LINILVIDQDGVCFIHGIVEMANLVIYFTHSTKRI